MTIIQKSPKNGKIFLCSATTTLQLAHLVAGTSHDNSKLTPLQF